MCIIHLPSKVSVFLYKKATTNQSNKIGKPKRYSFPYLLFSFRIVSWKTWTKNIWFYKDIFNHDFFIISLNTKGSYTFNCNYPNRFFSLG